MATQYDKRLPWFRDSKYRREDAAHLDRSVIGEGNPASALVFDMSSFEELPSDIR